MAIEKELLEGVALLKEGKEEGFNIVYSHTYNHVYSRAKCVMKNEDDALDLTQETFVQAYKGISSLQDPNNIYAWLTSITYNQGKKIYRKRKRELLVDEDSESIFEDIVSTDEELRPEESAQAKATSEIVMSMIDELPEVQRAAVVAFYYDNMKIEQIAELFECSANTIKSRLNYARKFLKGKVEEHERQNRYKLCAVSPAIMFMALKSLFASEAYTMAPAVAGNIYAAACGSVGVTASAITAGAATANAGTAAAATTKAGMTIGAKIGITATAIATAGAVGTGAFMYANSNLSEHAKIKAAIEEDLENRGVLEANLYNLDLYVDGVFAESTESENEIAQEILDEIITPEMSEFLQVKAIHDYMVMNLDSDYDFFTSGNIPESAYTTEGTLTTKYGISSGYARTFEVLCDNAGIECEYVVGTSFAGAIAWNQVKVDDQWYNMVVYADDIVFQDKAFDDHSSNNYSFFLVSDEEMYPDLVPHSPVQECTADSIGSYAYSYGWPWLELDPSIYQVETDEDIVRAVKEAAESGAGKITLFYPSDLYTEEYIANLAKTSLIKEGMMIALQRSSTETYGDHYFTAKTFHIHWDQNKLDIITSEEELKEYILELVEQKGLFWDHRYLCTFQVDSIEIAKWSLLNGMDASAYTNPDPYVPGYYSAISSISMKDIDILTTQEELNSKILEGYNKGLSEYTFLYDYRGTGMTPTEAFFAIRDAETAGHTRYDMARAFNIISDDFEGLLLYRCLYYK